MSQIEIANRHGSLIFKFEGGKYLACPKGERQSTYILAHSLEEAKELLNKHYENKNKKTWNLKKLLRLLKKNWIQIKVPVPPVAGIVD